MTLEESYITNKLFETIRDNSVYCTICGGKLDLEGFWHLPFCNKCRKKRQMKFRNK